MLTFALIYIYTCGHDQNMIIIESQIKVTLHIQIIGVACYIGTIGSDIQKAKEGHHTLMNFSYM